MDVGGLIGAMQFSIFEILEYFDGQTPSESDVLHYFFSTGYLERMTRCFAAPLAAPPSQHHRDFLVDCLLKPSIWTRDGRSVVWLNGLIVSGVLVKGPDNKIGFTSP